MKIREAMIDDAKELLKLEKEWLKEDISWGSVPPTLKELKEGLKKAIWYVAEDKDKSIIGFIQGEIIKSDRDKPAFDIKRGQRYGELYQVYVSKKFRGDNVGKILIKKLLDNFEKEKLKIVKLKAQSKKLQGLVNYYKKFGFKERIADMIKELR